MTSTAGPHWRPAWQARWIWSDAPTDAPFYAPPQPVPRHLWNRSCRLRRSFQLDSVPADDGGAVWCRVSADSRFVLYVNGVEVARGPARSVPERLAWVDVDLAPFLVPGDNVVAAVCRFYGAPTSWWRASVPSGQVGYGSFAFEAPALGIVSDDTWLAAPGPFLEAPEGANPLLEHVDAAVAGDGWQGVDYDDSGWSPAVALISGTFGTRRDTLPSQPYNAMEPGGMALQTRTPITGVAAATGRLTGGDGEPVALLALGVAPDGDAFSTFDLGTMTIGTPWADVSVVPGTIVDVYAGEDIDADGIAVIAPRHWAMRWVAAGGDGSERIASFEPVGHRYVTVVVRGEGTVLGAGAVEQRYPTSGTASFACNDAGLEAVWAMGVRTLELCSVDAFVDCPGRELQAWTGDAYVHTVISMAANSDWRLVRRYLRVAAQSMRPDGFLAMAAACGTSLLSINIPEYSADWIRALARYVLHSGDVATGRELLPAALSVVESFERSRDDDGLLHQLPGIVFVDWAQTERGAITLAIDGLYAAALADAAWLVDTLTGDRTFADSLLALRARTAAGFEALWDEERGAYVDAADDDGRPGRRLSQQTNALAIVGGAAPRERWDRILDTILDPHRVKRTLSNGDLPGHQHWSYQWWDPADSVGFDSEADVVESQPFSARFLHEAMAAAGRWDDLVASCRRWTTQIERGNTTFEEFWDAPPGTTSRCHAWSASPTWDLSAFVLGVQPSAVGYGRARIEPRFVGGIDAVRGRVPTPHGEIEVDLTSSAGGSVTIPGGIVADVVWNGTTTEVAGPGHTKIS